MCTCSTLGLARDIFYGLGHSLADLSFLCLVLSLQFSQGRFNLRRKLVETEVPYAVTVPGNTFQGLIQSINHFQNNFGEVAQTMGVEEEEVSDQ